MSLSNLREEIIKNKIIKQLLKIVLFGTQHSKKIIKNMFDEIINVTWTVSKINSQYDLSININICSN